MAHAPHPLGWPGLWTLTSPADPTAIADCEARIAMPLPEDLRAFLEVSDGGEGWLRWSGDLDTDPGFIVKVMSVAEIAGNFAVTSEFRGRELVPFASDGSREYFYLDRRGGPIVMIDVSGLNENGAPCGHSVSGLIVRLAEGWDPFASLQD